MSNSNGLYEFTAQIIDADTGVVIIHDYECELSCSWNGSLSVDYVFIRRGGKLVKLDTSIDPQTQRLVASVRDQAENTDWLIQEVYEDSREAA